MQNPTERAPVTIVYNNENTNSTLAALSIYANVMIAHKDHKVGNEPVYAYGTYELNRRLIDTAPIEGWAIYIVGFDVDQELLKELTEKAQWVSVINNNPSLMSQIDFFRSIDPDVTFNVDNNVSCCSEVNIKKQTVHGNRFNIVSFEDTDLARGTLFAAGFDLSSPARMGILTLIDASESEEIIPQSDWSLPVAHSVTKKEALEYWCHTKRSLSCLYNFIIEPRCQSYYTALMFRLHRMAERCLDEYEQARELAHKLHFSIYATYTKEGSLLPQPTFLGNRTMMAHVPSKLVQKVRQTVEQFILSKEAHYLAVMYDIDRGGVSVVVCSVNYPGVINLKELMEKFGGEYVEALDIGEFRIGLDQLSDLLTGKLNSLV